MGCNLRAGSGAGFPMKQSRLQPGAWLECFLHILAEGLIVGHFTPSQDGRKMTSSLCSCLSSGVQIVLVVVTGDVVRGGPRAMKC